MKDWIHDFGEGIKTVATYLSSPKFISDVKTFATDFDLVVQKLVAGLKLLGVIPDGKTETPAQRDARYAASDAVKVERLQRAALFAVTGQPAFLLPGPAKAAYDAQYGAGAGEATGGPVAAGFRDVPAGQSNAGGGGGAPKGSVSAAMKFFMGQGWTAAQASGIVANLSAESRLSPNPRGSNDGGTAYGVAQWHADRQADFNRWARSNHLPDLRHSSLQEQLQFVQYEITRGTRAWVGRLLKQATSAYDAGRVATAYEAPKSKSAPASRGVAAHQIYVSVNAPAGSDVAVQGAQLGP
jgi:hypothetical protein